MDPLFTLKEFNWCNNLERINFFDFPKVYANYIDGEGSSRLLKGGYSLFVSSYVKDIRSAYDAETDEIIIRARCYSTMKKSESKTLFFKIKTGSDAISYSYCTCKAGQDKCIHMVGLFHQLNHFIMLGIPTVPEEETCTMKEQEWHKPRGTKIDAEPLMEISFAKPTAKRKSEPEECSFKQILSWPKEEEVHCLVEGIKKYKPDCSFAYLLSTDRQESGTPPVGSTLHHQFCFQETEKEVEMEINLPISVSPFMCSYTKHHNYTITLEEAWGLEKETKTH